MHLWRRSRASMRIGEARPKSAWVARGEVDGGCARRRGPARGRCAPRRRARIARCRRARRSDHGLVSPPTAVSCSCSVRHASPRSMPSRRALVAEVVRRPRCSVSPHDPDRLSREQPVRAACSRDCTRAYVPVQRRDDGEDPSTSCTSSSTTLHRGLLPAPRHTLSTGPMLGVGRARIVVAVEHEVGDADDLAARATSSQPAAIRRSRRTRARRISPLLTPRTAFPNCVALRPMALLGDSCTTSASSSPTSRSRQAHLSRPRSASPGDRSLHVDAFES